MIPSPDDGRLADGAMRVLVVGTRPPTPGGITAAVESEIGALTAARIHCGCVNTGARVRAHPNRLNWDNGIAALRDAIVVWRAVRRCAPDVTHLHSTGTPTLPVVRSLLMATAVRAAGGAVVVSVHAGLHNMPESLVTGSRPFRIAWRALSRLSRRITVLSDAMADRLGPLVPAGRLAVLGNCVDTDAFRPGSIVASGGPPRVLYVGVIGHHKGVGDLLRVAASDSGETLYELVGGPGDEGPDVYAELQARAAALGGRVVFHGPQPPERVAQALIRATVAVLPSYGEGQPIAVLEAMAAGVPVVVSTATGLGALVEAEGAGVAVDAGNLEQLAQAIRLVTSHPDVAAGMGAAARAVACRRFDRTAWTTSLIEALGIPVPADGEHGLVREEPLVAVESPDDAPNGAPSAQRSRPWGALAVGALTATGLAMTASTYLVFVLVARRSSPAVVGMFALAMTLVAFAGQLADLGDAQYAVREVVRAGGALTMLRWAARRRMARALAFGVVAAAACWIRGIPAPTAAMVVGLVLAGTYFSLLQAACRAQLRFWRLSALQLLNGLAYFLAAVLAWLVWQRWTVSVAIGVPTAAVLLLVALTVGTGRRYFARPVGPIAHGRDRRSFARVLLSNVVTGNADILALGLYQPALAGRYATAERPAFGLAAVATAVTSVSLPRLATVSSRRLRSTVRRADLLIPVVLVAGLIAVIIGPPVLRAIYGNAGLVPSAVIPLMVVAYGLSIPHSLYGNTCLALHRGDYLSRVAAIQAVILVPLVVGWTLAGSLAGVAAGVLAARSVGIIVNRVFVARALRDASMADGRA